MRSSLLSLFVLPFLLLTASATPNLVMIFIDDMGYGDIQPFNSESLNRTPHLNRMAKEGMKLTSFYAAPVCSASRAQLLTGCYAPRVGVPGVFFPAGPKGLNPAEMTIAEYLKKLGYATTCVGKWHLGDQPEFLPTRHGFDHYFGIPYSNDMGRVATENGKRVHPLMRDEKVAELLEDEGQRRVTREYTEEAVKFIETNKDDPFFLYLPHTAMHIPLYPHEDFAGKSNNGIYGDWVEEVDWSVGQVLGTLKRLGLEKNTLVLFTSDNGPWASKGDRGGISGVLRGSKGGTLEGGVREPTIVWWPGTVAAGSSCDAVCGTIDVLPTFVSLAGGTPKSEIKIDGKDISKILTGESTESPHEAWYYYKGSTLTAVRSGKWKLGLKPQSIGMGFRDQPEDIRKPLRLYDLDEDIGETTDLAAEKPEVVARLQKLADLMLADIGEGGNGPGVRPCGEVSNPVTLYPSQPRTPRGPRKTAGKAKPVKWSTLKSGSVVNAASAPQIAKRGFEVRCLVDPGAAKETAIGTILAQGGSAIGYSLYATDSQLVFAVRNGIQIDRVAVAKPAGPARVRAGLSADAELHLQVDKAAPVKAKALQLIDRHPMEDLSIGHDSKNLVDDNSGGAYQGSVQHVMVEVEGKKAATVPVKQPTKQAAKQKAKAKDISWKKIKLTDKFYTEGAHYADFNKDGKTDVVVGPHWYEGPAFTKAHAYRPVKAYDPTKYSDNFLTYADDFDQDGWDDILIVGWPGFKKDWGHRWYQNPQGGDGDWKAMPAFKTVDGESPMFRDVTGDGKPELLFHTLGRLGYAEPTWDASGKEWAFTPVSEPLGLQRYTHGIGYGDVNGDGKQDLLLAKGWWENTGKPGQWKRHDVPFAPGKGGAQMYVYDVDGDGDGDVITSLNAHGYGLAWHEQTGPGIFKQHTFMNAKPEDNKYGVKFSQLHAIDLVDIDGDGLKDIITGKRWWAHGPKGDVEPNAAAVLYWFQLTRTPEGIDWVPHLIDDDSGVGTQVTAADLNNDGRIDIVVGNKKGGFVHLQE